MNGGPKHSTVDGSSCTAVFHLLLAAVSLALVFFFLHADIRSVVTVIHDDAAYFFTVAENIAAGKGLTFDGINRTNGVQPLWTLLLVPVFALGRASPETMYRACLVVQVVLLAAAALVLYRAHREFFPGNVTLASALVFLAFVFVPSANGMESALLVLLLSLLFYTGWRGSVFGRGGVFGRGNVAPHFLFGLILGLTVLARLDMVFLAAAVFAVAFTGVVLRRKGAAESKGAAGTNKAAGLAAIGALLGFVVIVTPYLLYNRISFGAFMPVSGMLKSSFPRPALSTYGFSKLSVREYVWILLAAAYLIHYALTARGRNGSGRGERCFKAATAVMAASVVMHALHTVLFMRWAVFRWHFTSYAFFGSLAVSEPVQRLLYIERLRRLRWLYWPAVAAVVVFGAYRLYARQHAPADRNWRVAAYEAALWAREHTERDEVFAMKDAGDFGYFSRRRVINLDGVVNSVGYQEVLKNGRLNAYFSEKGVRYLVQHAFWNRSDVNSGTYETYAVRYMSRRYLVESDGIVLGRGDEVYRSEPYFDGPYKTVFIIWRLPKDGFQYRAPIPGSDKGRCHQAPSPGS